MAEIDTNELARIVGHNGEGDFLRREAAIIKDKRQLSVRIPAKIAQLAKINPEEDKFEFVLVPLDDEGNSFTVKVKLKRGEDGGEEGIQHD